MIGLPRSAAGVGRLELSAVYDSVITAAEMIPRRDGKIDVDLANGTTQLDTGTNIPQARCTYLGSGVQKWEAMYMTSK